MVVRSVGDLYWRGSPWLHGMGCQEIGPLAVIFVLNFFPLACLSLGHPKRHADPKAHADRHTGIQSQSEKDFTTNPTASASSCIDPGVPLVTSYFSIFLLLSFPHIGFLRTIMLSAATAVLASER